MANYNNKALIFAVSKKILLYSKEEEIKIQYLYKKVKKN